MPSALPSSAGLGLPYSMPLDTTIGRVFVPYHPGGHHGHQFLRIKLSSGVVKSLSEASVKKARNRGPSTQLIEATSWVERWNTTI
jgi:hypothetical protein